MTPSKLPVRTAHFGGVASPLSREAVDTEWLLTNGLGGYASGTACGMLTRRFHGVLVAALPAPVGRATMLPHLGETVRPKVGAPFELQVDDRDGLDDGARRAPVEELRLEGGLPVFRYRVGAHVVEKRIVVVHLQNTVHVLYRLVSGEGPVRLELRPGLAFRPHEGPLERPAEAYSVLTADHRYEISGPPPYPPLRLHLRGKNQGYASEPSSLRLRYRVELARGYDHVGSLVVPGLFHADLDTNAPVSLTVSTEEWATMLALAPEEAIVAEYARRERLVACAVPSLREGPAAELVLAADTFVIVPGSRPEDAARARAEGEDLRAVIAGYPWFTDWGRDTMIALEGLTLLTGRHTEARYLLRAFGRYVRDGLVPNLFPEGKAEGLYHTADASLWYFHALARYARATGDTGTVRDLLPALRAIADAHLRGTRFGIGVDPGDGLLRQGESGYQLTWMDAKVDGWVVTPRRGKAVEINALFFNALSWLANWLETAGDSGAALLYRAAAERVRVSFDARFWSEANGHCFDVIDGENGDDAACRPNQLFAIALDFPVLAESRWASVLEACERRLATPRGLRSLTPGHPDYVTRYFGDLRARDAAYHQGTVWGFLIGPYADAWRKVRPDDAEGLRAIASGLVAHLGEGCLGQVSEIFDAEAPFTERGCCAQAWSVAELLRTLAMLA